MSACNNSRKSHSKNPIKNLKIRPIWLKRERESHLLASRATGPWSSTAATPFEVFSNPKNHVDATSSILTYSANAANFHPASQDITECAKQYDSYIDNISTFPGFYLTFNHNTESHQTSKNVDGMISDIKNAYEGVLAVDVKKIVDSVNQMANSVLSESKSEASQSLFSQSAVVATPNSNVVEVSIFYTTFSMDRVKGKKNLVEQSYQINRTVFKVLTSVRTSSAGVFAEKVLKASIDDWLKSNNAPTNPKILSCFEKHFQDADLAKLAKED
ncbi:hypothetical protein BGX28_003882 [Mortierella sp. GBA30]|nr:hypothetical protein BGX28_003882 [Mortierella sp. GBA30]